jgi:hypothetical protein
MKTNKLVLLLVAFALSACGSDEAPSGNNNGSGADAGLDALADAVSDSTTTADSGNPKSDAATDTSSSDASDMNVENFGRTLDDYRRCFGDGDCPVGLGTCITDIPLNQAQPDGSESVALSSIFTSLAEGEGVCSSTCTLNAAPCDELSVNGVMSDAEPYVCQLIFVGESPYPATPPAFPFDDQLDSQGLLTGTPFGALCRPPFQLDADVDRGFCAGCLGGADACAGTATCWDYLSNAAAADGEPGQCLGRCEGLCPSGFECTTLGDADYCVPNIKTCTTCLDLDGDGRGVGRCGDTLQPVTPVDCDDTNALAYYDPANPNHAFPANCAVENDFNCNGKSDADEQIASPLFGDNHCTSCFDTCSDPVLNGNLACVQGACIAVCQGNWATCDDDEINGCEQSVNDPTLVYFADADDDGYGDLSNTQFTCNAGVAPRGYVANSDDCNDTDPGSFPNAPELCDGVDNDCDMAVDNGVLSVGDACTAAAVGICQNGTFVCNGVAGISCEPATPIAETCNGFDDNCDGQADLTNGVAPLSAPLWYADCDNDNFGSGAATARCDTPASAPVSCPNGGWSLLNTDCDDTDPSIYPGRTEDCSTLANDNCLANDPQNLWINAVNYYADIDGDTYSPNPTVTALGCGGPPQFGWTPVLHTESDCNDAIPAISPAAVESCQTPADDNCNGLVHDATTGLVVRYPDVDQDNYGPNALAKSFCVISMTPSETANYSATQGGDCNDSTTTRTVSSNGHQYSGINQGPLRTEACDGFDNDCDGVVDDGCPVDYSITNDRIHPTLFGTNPTTSSIPLPSTMTSPMDSKCGANQVMVGIEVRRVDQLGTCQILGGVKTIRAICRNPNITVNANNDPFSYTQSNTGTTYGATVGLFGGDVGQVFCADMDKTETIYCSDASGKQVVTGVQGRDGALIDRIGLKCSSLALTTSVHPSILSINFAEDTAQLPPNFNGGGAFSDSCANNEVVTGISAYPQWEDAQGWILNGFKLRCSDLTLTVK